MKLLLASLAVLALIATGCEISPVVSAPLEGPGMRYSDCERAAEEYCEHSLRTPDREMDACVAEYRLKCLSSGARSSSVSRS